MTLLLAVEASINNKKKLEADFFPLEFYLH